ncbi:MAG: cysteine desulfurase / selenocysteine lyase [Rhodospirillaceae bacterium]|nr:MAG: cysteine desulfurase / selenocysteine lyase [Rhodospirillaceae bacterium]
MNVVLQTLPASLYDVNRVRADFPLLGRKVHGRPLVFLDSAASAQKPVQVIETVKTFYETEYANVHRGAYWLSEQATRRYEGAREKVRAFLNARTAREIIFTRGATESINLVAATWGRATVQAGDEVVLTGLEHHSNIVPWQMLAAEKGIVLKVVPVTEDGRFDWESYETLLSSRTRLVAVAHVSNVLGTILPVQDITAAAHAVGAKVLVDGCQAVPHGVVDVRAIDCDFYVFSGHKLYGPTGIGVLYGREALLRAMPPYQGGGDMIASVSFEGSTWAAPPQKFEAGTPAIAQAVGLAAAIDYVESLGLESIAAHETTVVQYATERLAAIKGVRLLGTAKPKASVISFTLAGVHPHDIATILDREGVAIRAGHHCAQPLMQRFGVSATARASFGLYNTRAEADALADALETVQRIFG